MTDTQHPTLSHFVVISGGALSAEAAPLQASIGLRGNGEDDGFAAAVAAACGLPLPNEPCTMSADDNTRILWLGPDEWLIRTDPARGDDLEAALQRNLAGRHAAVIRMDHQYSALILGGSGLDDILSGGTAIAPGDITATACIGTRFAHVPVILHRLADGRMAMLLRPSLFGYMVDWLEQAARHLALEKAGTAVENT